MTEVKSEQWIVRHYDGFDNEWMTVFGPDSKQEAQKYWNTHTNNGTKNTHYNDIDYYKLVRA